MLLCRFIYELFMSLLIFWNCLEIPFRMAFEPPLPQSYFIVHVRFGAPRGAGACPSETGSFVGLP